MSKSDKPEDTKTESKTEQPKDANTELMAQMVQGFNAMASAVNTMSEKIGTLTTDLAKNRQVVMNRHHEADEQNLGQDRTIVYGDDNEEIVLEETPLDPADPNFNKKMAQLAFDKEVLMVHMHEVSDSTAEKVVTIGVNGRLFHFERGKMYKVPRMAVEVLARARPVSYATQQFLNSQGKTDYREVSTTGLRYPFSLVNAKGSDQRWLNNILRSPQ